VALEADLQEQLRDRFRVSSCTAGRARLPLGEMMGTAGLNALAMMRRGAFRLMHRGAREGLGYLLIGLVAIAVALLAVARAERNEAAKN